MSISKRVDITAFRLAKHRRIEKHSTVRTMVCSNFYWRLALAISVIQLFAPCFIARISCAMSLTVALGCVHALHAGASAAWAVALVYIFAIIIEVDFIKLIGMSEVFH